MWCKLLAEGQGGCHSTQVQGGLKLGDQRAGQLQPEWREQWEGEQRYTQICAQTHTPEAPPGGPHPKVPLPNNTSNMPSCKYQFRDRWEMSALPLEGRTPKTKLSTRPGKEFLRCRLPQN